ncbi:MAG: M1 family metallopeptidase [Ginsengibacter sp.]
MKIYISFIFAILVNINPGFSQQLFTNTNVKKAVERGTRTATGMPGKNYWQNKADYDIKVHFDPATQLLEGKQSITYYNNSPDTLKTIIIRLYPDLYKKGVERLSHIADSDLSEGVQISSFKIGQEQMENLDKNKNVRHQNTNLYIKPATPLFPRTQTTLEISWNYKVNTGSPVRTGMVDSSSYFIAYFFPKIAVYDDIDGWDTWSYNGSQEFYNDFGNYNVEVSLPKDYVVWATGERMNAEDNFSQNILDKIKTASTSDKIIHVIEEADYTKNDVLKNNASGNWKFKATNVTDFVFALSNHYLWDVSSVVVDSANGRRSLAESAYNKIHLDYFDVADQTQKSLFYMSHFYPKYPFPFPKITVFDGTDQMEYPMMVNDNPTESRKDAVQLTTHEIMHSYFPFFMGTNETQYAWMDEGWATIGESVISPLMGEPEDEGIFSKTRYEFISGSDKDVPLITNTKLYQDAAYAANSYGKAGLCYYVLQDMLGDSLYFKALHHYMNNWNGKHPVPYDFFYSFNAGSGKDLNWFWNKWFFGWEYPDLAIKSVLKNQSGIKITIENIGGLPVPVYLDVELKSGKHEIVKLTAEAWKTGNKDVNIAIKNPIHFIQSLKVGNEFIPEKNKKDNSWKNK